MFGYIYKTTNKLNGKIYIGQKKSEKFLHEKYLGSGKILHQAILENGKENFSIELLEECDTSEQLNEREIYWISFYNSTNPEIGYNLSKGGYVPRLSGIHNGFYGKHHSAETRAKFKLRKKLCGEEHPRFGKHLSEEAKKRISDKNRGRIKTPEEKQKRLETMNKHGGYGWWIDDEYRQKLSLSQQGRNDWAQGTIWINNGNQTKMIHPDQLDKYISQGWVRGRLRMSEEQKKKIGDAVRGHTAQNKGTIVINKNGIEKFILPDDIDTYLNDGWDRGRAPISEETRRKISESARSRPKGESRVWITDGINNKRVTKDDLEEFLNNG